MEEMAINNGFNLKLIHTLTRKHKAKQNNSITNIYLNKPNKLIIHKRQHINKTRKII